MNVDSLLTFPLWTLRVKEETWSSGMTHWVDDILGTNATTAVRLQVVEILIRHVSHQLQTTSQNITSKLHFLIFTFVCLDIMQHATDSANTAGTLATGHKSSVNMVSVDLYEEKVSTLVEDAMMCGKAGGVVTSVPILHATPGAFVAHSNDRQNSAQLRRTFEIVNPTLAMGMCQGSLQPSESWKNSILNGSKSSEWTFLRQGRIGRTNMTGATAANFYDRELCMTSCVFFCGKGKQLTPFLFCNSHQEFGPR